MNASLSRSSNVQSAEMPKKAGEKLSNRSTWRQNLSLALVGKLSTDDAKRLSHYQLTQLAIALAARNWKVKQIAELFGITERAVQYRLSRKAFPTGKRGGTRYMGCYVPKRIGVNIDEVCDDAKSSSGALLSRTLGIVFETVPGAKKYLGKHALPTRPTKQRRRQEAK